MALNIDLKKEKFDEIDSAFADIIASKSKQGALTKIEKNLKDVFHKDITVDIIDNTRGEMFIMSIFPDQSTIDKIIDAIVNEKSDDLIRAAWNSSPSWHIEIDNKILHNKELTFNSRELTAFLLHEIGHIVYSDSVPQRISRVMRLEYSRAHISIKKALQDKTLGKILTLPIMNAGMYDNYRTGSGLKKELKADVFVVKMGYGEDLDKALGKIIALSKTKVAHSVDKDSQNVYNDMKSMTLFSINTIKEMQERKDNVAKANFNKLLITCPSKYVQKSIKNVSDTFFKAATKSMMTDEMKTEWVLDKVEKITSSVTDQYMTEAFGVKKMKKIDPMDFDYIDLNIKNIKSNDDKMALISYIYSKLNLIDYYIEILNSPSAHKYYIPHSLSDLQYMRDRLLKSREFVMNYTIPDIKYGIFVNYPKGYEG